MGYSTQKFGTRADLQFYGCKMPKNIMWSFRVTQKLFLMPYLMSGTNNRRFHDGSIRAQGGRHGL
ncbi:hypothetical protein DBP04_26735 [Escherichia sp. R8]|nr:hypothetical protein DBP04_26735 [Escherichia sp. R8]